jgi:ParB family chromosome partitioning protein
LLKLKTPDQQEQALVNMINDDWTVREAERFGDLIRDLDGDIAAALAALRDRPVAQPASGKPARPADRAPATTAPRTLSAEDHDVKREMERILRTPVLIARHDSELRVTIVFHTEENLQEFFDLLNARSH